MKFNTLIFSLMVIGLTNISCKRESSNDIKDDKIWKSYTVKFDEEQNDFKVNSTFRIGNSWGTKLKLTGNSSVSFGGVDLQWKSTLAFYEYKQNSAILDGSFFWTDDNGITAEYYTPIYKANLPTNINSFNRDEETKLFWLGETLRKNETLTVIIIGKLGLVKEFDARGEGTNYVTLNRTEINDLALGNAILFFRRELRSTFNDQANGGTGNIEFTSSKENITIY